MFNLTSTQESLLAASDEQAFSDFYQCSVDIFYNYMKGRYFFMSTGDIDDLVSDVYVKIWKGLSTYDTQYSFETFARSIVNNHLKDYFKKKKLTYDADTGVLEANSIVGSESEMIDQLELKHVSGKVQEALHMLDEASYQIIYFKYMQEFTYDEIEKITGISKTLLRKRVSRALVKIKEKTERF